MGSAVGSARVDLGGGVQAVREYDRVWLERGPVDLKGEVRWAPGESARRSLAQGPWLARRGPPRQPVEEAQDVFVDAKVPRSQREAWPLVVRGDEVVAVPGIVEAEGVKRVVQD